MNAAETIKKISLKLEENGFTVVEQHSNYKKLKSKAISISISNDPRENAFSVFFGRNNGEMNELNDRVLIDVFKTNFQELQGTNFAEKFINFLQGKGSMILKNDLTKISEVEAYCKKANEDYTAEIINKQK